MGKDINEKLFKDALAGFLGETFNSVEGIYLDKGTSLFETMNSVTAKEASTPARPGGTTIAAHADHIDFYLKVISKYMQGGWSEKIDWKQSWLTNTVKEKEWEALKKKLSTTRDEVIQQINSFDDWNDDKKIGGAMAVVVHTAFHIGAIRQILRTVKK
ncbi:MAG TPA: DinB family protein [candidate division Zixibacteria bacterium]|nr:DinB family protein [candidate division Zixibacteria bacterium]